MGGQGRQGWGQVSRVRLHSWKLKHVGQKHHNEDGPAGLLLWLQTRFVSALRTVLVSHTESVLSLCCPRWGPEPVKVPTATICGRASPPSTQAPLALRRSLCSPTGLPEFICLSYTKYNRLLIAQKPFSEFEIWSWGSPGFRVF